MWGRSDGLMYEVYEYEESNNDEGQLGVLMNVLQGKVKCYHSISYLSQHGRRGEVEICKF